MVVPAKVAPEGVLEEVRLEVHRYVRQVRELVQGLEARPINANTELLVIPSTKRVELLLEIFMVEDVERPVAVFAHHLQVVQQTWEITPADAEGCRLATLAAAERETVVEGEPEGGWAQWDPCEPIS